MATLNLPGIGTLNIQPHGLSMHTFAGLIMKSSVEIQSQKTRLLAGFLLSGPSLVTKIRSFALGHENYFSYRDESDDDLPSRRLSLSILCTSSDLSEIEISSEFTSNIIEPYSWLNEVNQSLSLQGRLGAGHFSAQVDCLDPQVCLVMTTFKAAAATELCRQFASRVVVEFEEAKSHMCSM